MWNNRSKSLALLDHEFSTHRIILDDLFKTLDATLDLFAPQMGSSDFHRACGFVVAKARHLGQANYSLILDGLGQESGAVLRPLIECLELLQYFQDDPSRVGPVLEGSPLKAGEVAQAIKGKFRGLRGYLNAHASHFSFDPTALSHLFDFQMVTFRSEPVFSETTLDRNLKMLSAVLLLIATASVNSLQTIRPGSADDLAEKVVHLHARVKEFARSLGIPEEG